MLARQK
jgi:hypothetical protein